MQPPSIVRLLKRLVGLAAAHIRTLHSREQGDIAQMVDLLLPLRLRILRGVDVVDTLPLAGLDHVGDPAALDFDCGWAVGEQGWALGAVEIWEG